MLRVVRKEHGVYHTESSPEMCNKFQICHFYDTAVSQQVGRVPRHASFLSTISKPTVMQEIAKVAKMKAQRELLFKKPITLKLYF